MPLCGTIVVWEGGELWGVSQKTCQITVLKLSRKELKNETLCMRDTGLPLFHLFHVESCFECVNVLTCECVSHWRGQMIQELTN